MDKMSTQHFDCWHLELRWIVDHSVAVVLVFDQWINLGMHALYDVTAKIGRSFQPKENSDQLEFFLSMHSPINGFV